MALTLDRGGKQTREDTYRLVLGMIARKDSDGHTYLGPAYDVTAYGATGDGTTDDTQALIDTHDDIGTDGGTIIFPPGTYIVQGHQFKITKSNVTVWLQAGATIKLRSADVGTDTSRVIWFDGSGGAISNVGVIGPGIVDGNATTGWLSSGKRAGIIGTSSITDAFVHGVTVQNVQGNALWFEGTSGTHNDRLNITDCFVNEAGEGIVWQWWDNAVVSNNLIDNINSEDGIEPVTSLNYSITNNIVRNCGQSGVNPFNAANNGIVAGNVVDGFGQVLSSAAGIAIDTSLEQTTVWGNMVINGTAASETTGIRTQSACTDTVIVDNVVHNCGQGVYISSSTDVDSLVKGNLISECLAIGIAIEGDRAVVADNVLRDNGQNSTGIADGAAIHLRPNCSAVHCRGNKVYDTQGTPTQYGIYIQENSGTSVIEDNDIGAIAGTQQIQDNGAAGNLIRRNNGWVTEAQGTATVTSGNTSVDVTHGLDPLDSGPDALGVRNFMVTPTNNLGNASLFWISNVNQNTFRINVDSDPGASTATFAWSAMYNV